uniref:Uncharacterized protein n=1 Tax=Saccharum officinarum TaxID=4547 RepID=A0A678TH05_SACOF|nr:hypothetical protein SO171L14_000008 [Saccharum officinarum]
MARGPHGRYAIPDPTHMVVGAQLTRGRGTKATPQQWPLANSRCLLAERQAGRRPPDDGKWADRFWSHRHAPRRAGLGDVGLPRDPSYSGCHTESVISIGVDTPR